MAPRVRRMWMLAALLIGVVSAGCSSEVPALTEPPATAGLVVIEGRVNLRPVAVPKTSGLGDWPIERVQIGNATTSLDSKGCPMVASIGSDAVSSHKFVLIPNVPPGEYRLLTVEAPYLLETLTGTESERKRVNLAESAGKAPSLTFKVEPGMVTFVGEVYVTLDGEKVASVTLVPKPEYYKATLETLVQQRAYSQSPWMPVFRQALEQLGGK